MREGSNRILYIVSLNHATNDGSVYLLSSLFPVVISLFDVSVFQVGVIVAIGYLVNVLIQPVVGHYGERRNPAKMLAAGISLISISIASFVFATGFLSLLASVIVLRLGSSFFHPIGISTVSKVYRGPGLQRSMGFQSAFGNFGVLLTFLIAAPLYLSIGWRATFLVFLGWTLADVLVTVLALRGDHQKNLIDSGGLTNNDGSVSARIPVFFVVAAFISGGTYAVILNFANIFLGTRTNLDVSQANWIVSAFIGFAFLGALATGVWGRFIPTSLHLALAYLLAAVTIATFTVFSADLFLAVATLIANGFFISSTYPLTYTELSRYLGAVNRPGGRSFGILSSGQTIGASVLGLFSGYVSQYFGLEASFAAVAILAFLGGLLTLVWTRNQVAKGL